MPPLVLAGLLAVSAAARAEEGASRPVSFLREVAPILVGKCQACHGPKTAESDYRLDTFELMMQPGNFGSAPITAGNLDDSEFHRLITAEDPDERMPNNGDHLSKSEIGAISNWIMQGATFDGQDAAASLRAQIPRDIPHPAAPSIYPTAFPITAMTFTPDGAQLVVGGYHELLMWDPTNGVLTSRLGNIPQRTFGVAFSSDQSWLAVAGGAPGVSGEVRLVLWGEGPHAGVEPKVLATGDDVFYDVAFRPDGQRLAAGGADGSVRVFDVAAGTELLKISNHADWVTDVCFSPDGARIAAASRDKTAKVFDAETGRLLATYSAHEAPVRGVAFSPDGKSVISAGGNLLRVWNVDDVALVGEMTGFGKELTALLAGGENVIAASADRSVRQFKLADRTLVRSLTDNPAWILSIAWNESSHRIAAGGFDGVVTVWNLDDGAVLKQFSATPK